MDSGEESGMSKAKRTIVTPYQRLAQEFDQYKFKVACPRRVTMWQYPKEKLNELWRLYDLWERTKAADQLGYDVVLIAADEGLKVQYVAKRPA